MADGQACRCDSTLPELKIWLDRPLMKTLQKTVVALTCTLITLAVQAAPWTATAIYGLGGTFTVAEGVNAAGMVFGRSATASNGSYQAFSYSNGVTTQIGTLGGVQTTISAMNNAGQLVGRSFVAGNTGTPAVLYSGGTLTNLGTLGGASSYATAISANGVVIGSSTTTTRDEPAAFVYQNGVMTSLAAPSNPGNSFARDVNDSGQVAGTACRRPAGMVVGGTCNAFIYSNGVKTDIANLAGTESGDAVALNNGGQLIGNFRLSGDNYNYRQGAFLYSNGEVTDLGTLDSRFSTTAIAINDAGQVLGQSGSRGFLYEEGRMTDLGSLGGRSSDQTNAVAMNESGQVIGSSTGFFDGANGRFGFLYSEGAMTRLVGLRAGDFTSARAINAAGQVLGISSSPSVSGDTDHFLYDSGTYFGLNDLVAGLGITDVQSAYLTDGYVAGSGLDSAGRYQAFLLTRGADVVSDVPEPGSLGLAGAALAGALTVRRRRR